MNLIECLPAEQNIGLLPENFYKLFKEKSLLVERMLDQLTTISIKPELVNDFLVENSSAPINQKAKLYNIISRPQITLKDLFIRFPSIRSMMEVIPDLLFSDVIESVEIRIKYAGYINREKSAAEKLKRLENVKIDNRFDYQSILSLSTEAREKLAKINPKTIGQAHRIPGISPNDINVLLVLLGR